MISTINDALVALFFGIGIMFFVGGTVGLLRCPDCYARLHPATKCDTLGACSITLALTIDAGLDVAVIKMILVIFLLLLTSAPSGHAIGRSAYLGGIKAWTRPTASTGGGKRLAGRA